MYEHTFVKVELSNGLKVKPKEDYHDIVYKHEKEGWELVQIFAPAIKHYGIAAYYELIFKRKTNE